MTATAKQISYAMHLLGEAGYSTRYMDASFRDLGAKMRQRSGSVRDWLASMSRSGISTLIDQLA
jgi:hypothetical protein